MEGMRCAAVWAFVDPIGTGTGILKRRHLLDYAVITGIFQGTWTAMSDTCTLESRRKHIPSPAVGVSRSPSLD